MVISQILAEMEEIIDFRKLEGRAKAGTHRHPANREDSIKARQQLLSVWRKRLSGCRLDAEIHSTIFAVRSLVLGPTDEVDATLTLSSISRHAQRYKLAERVLLDPLEKLGADLNGSQFGFNLPPSLGLGLLKNTVSNFPRHIDQLVNGEATLFLPQYGEESKSYCQKLVQDAGGHER